MSVTPCENCGRRLRHKPDCPQSATARQGSKKEQRASSVAATGPTNPLQDMIAARQATIARLQRELEILVKAYEMVSR